MCYMGSWTFLEIFEKNVRDPSKEILGIQSGRQSKKSMELRITG